jgi:hypothetical protein
VQPPRDAQRTGPRRARWLLAGGSLLAAGTGWLVWVTYGPPADWSGAAAAIRYSKPVVWAVLAGAAVCFLRAGRR